MVLFKDSGGLFVFVKGGVRGWLYILNDGKYVGEEGKEIQRQIHDARHTQNLNRSCLPAPTGGRLLGGFPACMYIADFFFLFANANCFFEKRMMELLAFIPSHSHYHIVCFGSPSMDIDIKLCEKGYRCGPRKQIC